MAVPVLLRPAAAPAPARARPSWQVNCAVRPPATSRVGVGAGVGVGVSGAGEGALALLHEGMAGGRASGAAATAGGRGARSVQARPRTARGAVTARGAAAGPPGARGDGGRIPIDTHAPRAPLSPPTPLSCADLPATAPRRCVGRRHRDRAGPRASSHALAASRGLPWREGAPRAPPPRRVFRSTARGAPIGPRAPRCGPWRPAAAAAACCSGAPCQSVRRPAGRAPRRAAPRRAPRPAARRRVRRPALLSSGPRGCSRAAVDRPPHPRAQRAHAPGPSPAPPQRAARCSRRPPRPPRAAASPPRRRASCSHPRVRRLGGRGARDRRAGAWPQPQPRQRRRQGRPPRRPARRRSLAHSLRPRAPAAPAPPAPGTGSCEHIGAKVSLPKPIPLKDGVYEVGATSGQGGGRGARRAPAGRRAGSAAAHGAPGAEPGGAAAPPAGPARADTQTSRPAGPHRPPAPTRRSVAPPPPTSCCPSPLCPRATRCSASVRRLWRGRRVGSEPGQGVRAAAALARRAEG
jgi:hypothetical protein